MGYNVGTLSRLPLAIYDHYIYVVGDPEINPHAKWIERNFSRIAKSLATGTAIVMGTDARVSGEINDLLAEWCVDPSVPGLFTLLADGTFLVIAKGDIRKTDKPLIIVPLDMRFLDGAKRANQGDEEQFMEHVFTSVCEAIKTGTLDKLVQGLGAVGVPIRPVKGGLWFTTFKRANEVLHLKPSLCGIGININAAIDGWLNEQRVSR